jgi:hypothetical protein
VILFALGKKAPPAFRETPCYVLRKAHTKYRKHLKAIPEGPVSDDDTTTVFDAMAEYLEHWRLKEDLYSDLEMAERDATDEDPMYFHPGISLETASEALSRGGFRVIIHPGKKGALPLRSTAEELKMLEHHLELSSIALARKTSAATFSHHHLEHAAKFLLRGARAPFAAEFLKAVEDASPRWPAEAQEVLQFLVKRELANPEGIHQVKVLLSKNQEKSPAARKPKPSPRVAPKTVVKSVAKSVKKLAGR